MHSARGVGAVVIVMALGMFTLPIAAQEESALKDSVIQQLTESEGYELVGSTLIHAEVDPITDETKAMAVVPSESLSLSEGGILFYRCTDEELEVYVNVREYLGDDDRDVVYRFDDLEPEEESWSISTDGSAVFADDDREFARRSAGADKLAFRAFDYDGTPHTVVFELDGFKEAVGQLPCISLSGE